MVNYPFYVSKSLFRGYRICIMPGKWAMSR
jgi:hypothetical protein